MAVQETEEINAENVFDTFPDVKKLSTTAVNNAIASTDLDGYDEEQRKMMEEEMCIVVDRDDNPIGMGSKKTCHLMKNINKGLVHRAFSLFLFDSENRLLLQQRASGKITFSDAWSNTCCSHPLAIPEELGEGLEASLTGVLRATDRKLNQELGIRLGAITRNEIQFLTRIHYKSASNGMWGEHEIDYILIAKPTVPIELNINTNEVQAVSYVSKSKLQAMLADEKTTFTPWFKLVCESTLFEWWDHLDQGLEKYGNETSIRRMI